MDKNKVDELVYLYHETINNNGIVVGFFTTDWEKTRFAFPSPMQTNMYILHEHDDKTMKMCSKGIVFLKDVETQEKFINSAIGHSILFKTFTSQHAFHNALFEMNAINHPF